VQEHDAVVRLFRVVCQHAALFGSGLATVRVETFLVFWHGAPFRFQAGALPRLSVTDAWATFSVDDERQCTTLFESSNQGDIQARGHSN